MSRLGEMLEVLGVLGVETEETRAMRMRYHGTRAIAAVCACGWLRRVWRFYEMEARTKAQAESAWGSTTEDME